MEGNFIKMVHGSGGAATGELIHEVFASAFHNRILDAMEDAAVVPCPGGEEGDPRANLAVTTDSFVVDPVEYAGGDIGRLAVCGTVNDLLMRGAIPRYLTSAWILREGTDIEQLKRVVASMAETASEAGVSVICGDTKVVEAIGDGQGGIYVNTTGVGYVPAGVSISAAGAKPGDKIIVSGTMGDHHAAILSERMSIENEIVSDTAPLVSICDHLRRLRVHVLRDVTRGGLATVLSELATASGKTFTIYEEAIPVSDPVRSFCGLLGLDPLYMGNEGKLVCVVDPEDEKKALNAIRSSRYGERAAVIGEVSEKESTGELMMRTAIGGIRALGVMQGEGLPRIC